MEILAQWRADAQCGEFRADAQAGLCRPPGLRGREAVTCTHEYCDQCRPPQAYCGRCRDYLICVPPDRCSSSRHRYRIEDDAILYAFAVEPTHDRSTLERYLREYPARAEDLIDLSSLLHREVRFPPIAEHPLPDPGLVVAWRQFIAIKPRSSDE